MGSFVKVWPLTLVLAIHSGCGSSEDDDNDTGTPATTDPLTTDGPTDSQVTETPSTNTTPDVTVAPTVEPTQEPTEEPTDEPTEEPTDEPTDERTDEPTDQPTDEPTEEPTAFPTPEVTAEPSTPKPTLPPPTPAPTDTPSTPTPTPLPDTPTPCVPSQGTGLTYGWATTDLTLDVVTVGCSTSSGTCLPYVGDTNCEETRPVLCIKQDGSPSPSASLTRWINGYLATTPPVKGTRLTSQQAGDQMCQATWGSAWRMAEWHDQPNGPSMQGYGMWESDVRLWVAINNQPANCWNSVKTTCETPDSRVQHSPQPPLWSKTSGTKGMTYDWLSTNTTNHSVRMGCYATSGSCDPYVGDKSCDIPLPLLCIDPKASDLSSPGGDWTGGKLGATPPLKGTRFSTINDANTMCQRTFGSTWRVAEFHDYSSGFSMSGEGQWISDSRMWVDVNDQSGNCWSHSVPD